MNTKRLSLFLLSFLSISIVRADGHLTLTTGVPQLQCRDNTAPQSQTYAGPTISVSASGPTRFNMGTREEVINTPLATGLAAFVRPGGADYARLSIAGSVTREGKLIIGGIRNTNPQEITLQNFPGGTKTFLMTIDNFSATTAGNELAETVIYDGRGTINLNNVQTSCVSQPTAIQVIFKKLAK